MIAILDIDGTLVDTNFHHAIAWYRAFRQHDVVLPIWRIHRSIGKGGDQLVADLAGEDFDAEHGDDVRSAEKVLYLELISEVEPVDEAPELIADLKERGHRVVLASSAKADEVDHYLDQLDVRDVVDDWTTSADVEQTKPAPDLLLAALEKVGGTPDDAVLIGDSIWDCAAAEAAGIATLGLLTGGFSAAELEDAGAIATFESIADLRQSLDATSLA